MINITEPLFPELITLEEACKKFNFTMSTIKSYLKENKIDGIKESGKWRYVTVQKDGQIRKYQPPKLNHNFIDITGEVFGDLTAIKYLGTKRKRYTTWQCKCSCGNTCEVTGYNLRCGDTKSCGCRVHKKKPIEELVINERMLAYKQAASLRKLKFNLSREEFFSLITQNCYYCDSLPSNYFIRKYGRGCEPSSIQENDIFYYSGIDRLDNNEGYNLNNCVPCCKLCNQAKMDLKEEEFKNLIINIYNNYINKN